MKVNHNRIINQNKTMNFGVKKTDSVESFVNEIKVMNPEIRQHIDNLPIIKTIQEHDTFESLVKRANANKTMFDNVNQFSIYTPRCFRILINAIGRKIIENLKASGITLTQFMFVIEDDKTGEKALIDMVKVARQKEYNEANKEKLRAWKKKYIEINRKEIQDQRRKYNLTHREERKKYEEENKEQINIRRKIYYELHKTKLNAYSRKYHVENKEKLKAYYKQYNTEYKKDLKIHRQQYNIEHREEIKVKKRLRELTNQLQIYYANLKNSVSQKVI